MATAASLHVPWRAAGRGVAARSRRCLHPHLGDRVAEAAACVRDEYGNQAFTDEVLSKAIRGSAALVGALDAGGRGVATARAVSESEKLAYIAMSGWPMPAAAGGWAPR